MVAMTNPALAPESCCDLAWGWALSRDRHEDGDVLLLRLDRSPEEFRSLG